MNMDSVAGLVAAGGLILSNVLMYVAFREARKGEREERKNYDDLRGMYDELVFTSNSQIETLNRRLKAAQEC